MALSLGIIIIHHLLVPVKGTVMYTVPFGPAYPRGAPIPGTAVPPTGAVGDILCDTLLLDLTGLRRRVSGVSMSRASCKAVGG